MSKKKSKGEADKLRREKPGKNRKVFFFAVIILTGIMIISVAVVLGTHSSEKNYDSYMDTAKKQYFAGDYDSSLANLRKASKIDESDECLLLMADCYIAQDNYDRALELLRQLNLDDPAVAGRIENIERDKELLVRGQQYSVGGIMYESTATSISVNDVREGNSIIEDAARFYALKELSAVNDDISDLSMISTLGGLTKLNLSDNNISDISALSSLTELRTLYLDNNPVEDFSPLLSLNKLTMLSICGTDISEEKLEMLSQGLPGCAIHKDSDSIDNTEISFCGIVFDRNITKLVLTCKGITDISALSACTSLKEIDLSDNSIYDIMPIMDIPGLTELSIKNNFITDLRPLMGITSLKYLNAEGNTVSSTVSLGNLTNLSELYLAGNPIKDFSGLARLESLTTLGLENTGIHDEDLAALAGLSKLKLLLITDNPEITGNAVDELKEALPNCKIYTSKDMVYLVDFGGYKFRTDAEELNAAGLEITDISAISRFENLQKVNLCNNHITDISAMFWLKGIVELDLSGNELVDVSVLAYMPTVEYLNVSDNQIDSIAAFVELSNLKELHIGGNDLSEETLEQLSQYLPDCTIYY